LAPTIKVTDSIKPVLESFSIAWYLNWGKGYLNPQPDGNLTIIFLDFIR
jgi:hypothetical protein